MKKKSRRTIRPSSAIIPPYAHTDLVTGPRFSLTALLANKGTIEDLHRVTGLLNIGSALALLAKNTPLQALVSKAQDVCLEVAANHQREGGAFSIPDEKSLIIKTAVNQIDRRIGVTTKNRLYEAVKLVCAEFDNKAADAPWLFHPPRAQENNAKHGEAPTSS